VRGDGAHSGNALKLAHLPKFSTHTLDLLESFFPLRNGVIVLAIESPDHTTFLFARQLLEILLADSQ
jgi:hypothetical protein